MSGLHSSTREAQITKHAATKSKNLLVVCSAAWSITAFRGDLIEELKDSGYTVLCAIPDSTSDKQLGELADRNINYVLYPLARSGMNPFKDFRTLIALVRIIRSNHINLVFPYTIKPVIYGSLAARINRTPVVALITGLGFSFSRASRKARVLEKLNILLYRASISKSTHLIFQNPDDLKLFKKVGITQADSNCTFVDGSGINTIRFPQRSIPAIKRATRFLMVSRLIREKGVLLYIEAAKQLKKDYPEVQFSLVGSVESTPSAIPPLLIREHHEQGTIRFVGQLDDVGPEYQASDVFVLPTYYREGIPRSILEAMSSGLAIITTDSPGCRETVKDSDNGFLVEPQNIMELTNKIKLLIDSPDRVYKMGAASRKLSETRFNVTVINKQMLVVFDKAINQKNNTVRL
jgi:glycosyltransferase involved in cell wall biosynthesis